MKKCLYFYIYIDIYIYPRYTVGTGIFITLLLTAFIVIISFIYIITFFIPEVHTVKIQHQNILYHIHSTFLICKLLKCELNLYHSSNLTIRLITVVA